MATFDRVAADFERFRSLPALVPVAVRAAVLETLGLTRAVRLLDVGAGTGRIGAAFVTAGDSYFGIDPSAAMLAQFVQRSTGQGGAAPQLVKADGRQLPFSAGQFDAVLLIHVLSGVAGGGRLVSEARRVLRRGGALVLGHASGPPEGLDARMRAKLTEAMDLLNLDGNRPGTRRGEARIDLAASAERQVEVVAARWETVRSPRDFLTQHQTGARFSSLPGATRDQLLRHLSEWAKEAFGDLDTASVEVHAFELDFFLLKH
jgi:ubiquinone/menaquinone biosynthesis C-methylase UbiE